MRSVRSFDNQRSETIQFHTPLTLIVGYNGSGKTTIIECLKYATTGEQPPNSRGGAFIHDPKLCNEREVLAQVKLSFKATSGARMVATRSLQLTVKKTARTMKTLEGALVMIKDGERTAISSRVAELDQIMPQYLGVPKAVLESVIFCHQDDSLWPMSEPASLKKRFDEIFEALKYTKAIDNIKILRKKQNEELGKYKIIEQQAKIDKDKGERAEKRSNELQAEIEDLRVKVFELKDKIDEAKVKSREAWDHAAKFEKIVGTLEVKRMELQTTERSVNSLKGRIKEMTDSDEELQAILDRYQERVTLYEQENETLRRQYGELAKEVEQSRRALGVKQSEIGKFEAQKDQYERQINNRQTLIKETARRHKIRGFDLDITDEHVRDFMERIGKMARDQNAAFERARRETQEELQKAQSSFNQINERKSALNQSKENSKGQMSANDRKMAVFQADVDKIEIDEGGRANLESTVEDVERCLSKAKADFDAANWDKQIQDTDAQLRSVDEKKEKLDAELIQGTKRAGDLARLDYLHKELKDRQRSLETMIGAHGDHITQVVGEQWSPSTLDGEFHTVLSQRDAEVKEAELQRDGTSRELEQVEIRLSTSRADLKRKRQEHRNAEQRVRDAIEDEPSEFPQVLEQLQKNRDITQQDATQFTNMKDYYEKCQKTLESHNTCLLCLRPMRNDKEKASFSKRVQESIAKAAQEASNEDFQLAEAELKKAKEASSDYDAWARLGETEIPALEKECRDLESRRDTLVAKVEEQDQIVNERQGAKRDVEALSRTVQNIIKYHIDIGSFESQIQELSAKQKDAGLSRGLEQIQEELKKVNEQARSVKMTLTQLSADRDHARSRINALELEARDVKSKLSMATFQLKERGSLVAQIEDLKSLNNEQRENIRRVDQDIQSLAPQIAQAQAKYDDISRRGAERDRELQQEASKLSDSVHQLKSADQEINAYLDRGGPQQLARTKREVESLEEELSRIETEQRQVTVDIKKIEDSLRNTADTRRSIADNLEYRRGVRDLDSVRAEIEQLESHNAETDRKRYEREGTKWQNEVNKLSAEQASVVGSMKAKDDILQKLAEEWETDYRDAPQKYKEAHIRVETTKAAVEDLGRYGGALDKAIMKYHSLKMEEINRIIEELWKKTYQGTDVDTILIRSDNESAKGNRSYNYRVCMVKQDAEMDMRGRCSAGQKVLASIIIRLALAECFGVNCGLIALDEPTTNLDRDNIRALAEALAEIIRVRRQQSNFQLIVITHDEDFLRYMQCADFCDTYYRVSRNERQKSIIERQSIAEVV
ncbi:DNA repair protein rad50 [Coniosporium apollinis]|uniref:DNA repair protein rad50 n=2 Tax=Coniosporium TaxID=2810619 RepID=A0ABQ9P177_9PEZI|nr:DNA repair protein rad50 [Cladosporium sp. JES 115]KAJ9668355.1 DNA repair protein rad50 [Coniosporium apollinis]